MNPALYTKWLYKYNGATARVKVVGIWGKGFGSQYEVVSYELKQDSKPKADLVSASKMAAMIKDGRLTYLAPGPEIPESNINRVSVAPETPILRPDPNNRRPIGGQEAKKRRSEGEARASRIEFKQ
jgi:hypothetical protein